MKQLPLPTLATFLGEEKIQRDAALPLLSKQLKAIRIVIKEHRKIRAVMKVLLNNVHFHNYNDSDSYLEMHEAEVRCLDNLIDEIDGKPQVYFGNAQPCSADIVARRMYHGYGVLLGYSSIDGELSYEKWKASDVKEHCRPEAGMRDAWNMYGDQIVRERRLVTCIEMIDALIEYFEQMHHRTLLKIKNQMPNNLAKFTVNIANKANS